MHTQANSAYRKVQKLAPAPRRVEAMAFAKAAALLEGARQRSDDYPAYAAALRFNQTMWTLVQADVAADGNTLPADLKRKIFGLSRFVDARTITALAEPAPEHLAALIEIDKNMARGQFAAP